MHRFIKWVGIGIGSVLIMASVLVAVATARVKLPGEEKTPAGYKQSSSTYVEMRDGVEIAVTVWLPADLKSGERVPVLMRTTRYWRAQQLGWGFRLLVALHQIHPQNIVDRQRAYFNERHFAVILVDARGSGASSGHRVIEYSPAEMADMGEVAAWAARQPRSSGRVGTFGISYEGNDAELAAVPNQPAIRAVMPLYDDFDTQMLIEPGGVALKGFVQQWSDLVAAMDRDDVCAVAGVKGFACWKVRQIVPGVRRADVDPHGKILAEYVSEHHNMNVAESVGKSEFRDDILATPEGVFHWPDINPYGLRAKIEASKVPMMVWCGWMDASPCEGALIRYRTFSNPQVVVIGPLNHGGDFNADPFGIKHTPPEPGLREQYKMEADFFDKVLRNDPQAITSSIQYYTMGEGKWHTTSTWPPAGLATERMYFGEHNALGTAEPTAASASDSYTVDFTASSGAKNRWNTQLGGGDVVYPDRANDDKKLLVYTGAPLETDLEITGSPIVTLEIASTLDDGAIHAYLEDVAPDGRVTYVDEGILRMIDRKEVDPKTLPYEPLGPAHSYLRKDAEPMVPGEVTTIRLSMYPTSVMLRAGHRIRIALAGADVSLFQRYPATGTPTWTVYREANRASFVELPAKKN